MRDLRILISNICILKSSKDTKSYTVKGSISQCEPDIKVKADVDGVSSECTLFDNHTFELEGIFLPAEDTIILPSGI